MTNKKGRYLSLADAGDILKKAMEAARQQQTNVPEKSAPQTSQASNGSFADIERSFLERGIKLNAPQPARQSKNKREADGGKHGQKAPAKEVLRGPAAREALRRFNEQEDQKREIALAQAQTTPARTVSKERECFDRIVALVSGSTPEIEERPLKVSKRTREAVLRAVSEGSRAFAAASEWDEDGFIVGFDLGTSSLKLAVRQPGYAGDPAAMMPVPKELQSGKHPHLWQTAVWFCPKRQTFSLLPAPGLVPLGGLKTGIIGGNGDDLVVSDQPVTRSEAATAFIALQIAHFFGWYHLSAPLGPAGSDKFLAIKIGIPVAVLDNAPTYNAFRRIVAAAKTLVRNAENLTLQLVRESLDGLDQSTDLQQDGWYLIPELTAAIAGYAASPQSQTGSHVLIDVGASTLDIVAFNLVGRFNVSVISAAVELLGSASLDVVRSAKISDDDFTSACEHQFASVFKDACRPSRGGNCFNPSPQRQKDVQLVTTGGGCASPLHAQFIADSNNRNELGSLPTIRPHPPLSCKADECDRSRLLLAYGLTRDEHELPILKPASQVPDLPPPPRTAPNFTSKEMT